MSVISVYSDYIVLGHVRSDNIMYVQVWTG